MQTLTARVSRRAAYLVPLIVAALLAIFMHKPFMDDAYISFRYAANLARGEGLVYNAGEWVEGYSNFLWTAYHAPFIAAGIPPEPVSVITGLICALGALALTVRLCLTLGVPPWLSMGAGLMLALYVDFWQASMNGLESGLYALALALALNLAVTLPRRAVWLSVVCALLTLIRPEGLGVGVIVLGYALVRHREALLKLALPFTLITLVIFGTRYAVYGKLLPNTMSAKGMFMDVLPTLFAPPQENVLEVEVLPSDTPVTIEVPFIASNNMRAPNEVTLGEGWARFSTAYRYEGTGGSVLRLVMGRGLQMGLARSPQAGVVEVRWNGDAETLDLRGESPLFALVERDFHNFDAQNILRDGFRYVLNSVAYPPMIAALIALIFARMALEWRLLFAAVMLFTLIVPLPNGGDWMPNLRLIAPTAPVIIALAALLIHSMTRHRSPIGIGFSGVVGVATLIYAGVSYQPVASLDSLLRDGGIRVPICLAHTAQGIAQMRDSDVLVASDVIGTMGYRALHLNIHDVYGLTERIPKAEHQIMIPAVGRMNPVYTMSLQPEVIVFDFDTGAYLMPYGVGGDAYTMYKLENGCRSPYFFIRRDRMDDLLPILQPTLGLEPLTPPIERYALFYPRALYPNE